MKLNKDKATTAASARSISSLRGTATASVMDAFNTGREAQAQGMKDQIDRVQSSALLDKETCDYCRALDGQETPYDQVDESVAPPYKGCGEGYGKCRCVWVYIFKREQASATSGLGIVVPPPKEEAYIPKNISIDAVGEVPDHIKELVQNTVNRVPDGFKANMRNIQVVDGIGNTFIAGGKTFSTAGYYDESNHRIVAYLPEVQNQSNADWVVAHELGHNGFRSAIAAPFLDAWNRSIMDDGEPATDYARDWYNTSHARGNDENFAEWTKIYVRDANGMATNGKFKWEYVQQYPYQAKVFDQVWKAMGGK